VGNLILIQFNLISIQSVIFVKTTRNCFAPLLELFTHQNILAKPQQIHHWPNKDFALLWKNVVFCFHQSQSKENMYFIKKIINYFGNISHS